MDREGTQNNPYQIKDDGEQMDAIQREIQLERDRHEFLQAQMGSRFDIIGHVIKADMSGTKEEKDERLRNRINKFFNSCVKKIDMRNGHFCERREPNYFNSETQPIQNELILFGVDFLNVRKIKNLFSGMNPTIEWLDDSNCKVKFQNGDLALKAIRQNLKEDQKQMLNVKMEEEDNEIPKGWFPMKPYFQLTFERELFCRYATSEEIAVQPSATRNFVYYNQAKKKFQQTLIKQNIGNYKRLAKNLGFIEERDRRLGRNSRNNNGFNGFGFGGFNDRSRDFSRRGDRERSREKNFGRRNRDDNTDFRRKNDREKNSERKRSRIVRNSSEERSRSISVSRRSRRRERSKSQSKSSDLSFILNPDDSNNNGLLIEGMNKLGINPSSLGNHESEKEINMDDGDLDDFDNNRNDRPEEFHYSDYIQKKEEQQQEEKKHHLTFIVID